MQQMTYNLSWARTKVHNSILERYNRIGLRICFLFFFEWYFLYHLHFTSYLITFEWVLKIRSRLQSDMQHVILHSYACNEDTLISKETLPKNLWRLFNTQTFYIMWNSRLQINIRRKFKIEELFRFSECFIFTTMCNRCSLFNLSALVISLILVDIFNGLHDFCDAFDISKYDEFQVIIPNNNGN